MSTSIEDGKRVIRIEADAVAALLSRVDASFEAAIDILYKAKGRVIITGMGKSGIVARKIAATMNSTGSPAIFLHPSDAYHGDLGMVQKNDVVICISKSGDTEEIHQLLPVFGRLGVPIISLVGKVGSELAEASDVVIDISVTEEACPHDLAPTSSTTAALVMGDALAITLLQRRNFTAEDFAMFHPGGMLGKKLLLQIEHLMIAGEGVPIVQTDVSVSDAIVEMTSKRLGATCVVGKTGALEGIITDGDLRRLLQKTSSIADVTAADAMTKNPKTLTKGVLAAIAIEEMESYKITQLVVVDDDRKPVGILHIHDLVKAGFGNGDTG
jgi:arabinose-5-phosphate isomerase